MAVYNRGWYDTRQHVENILQADEFMTRLVFRHLNTAALDREGADIVIASITIFSYARYPAHQKPIRSREYVDSLVAGEMMAPVVPQANSLNANDASTEFLFVMSYLMDNPTLHTRTRGYAAWAATINAAVDEDEGNLRGNVPARNDLAFDDYMDYLIWLAYNLPHGQFMSPIVLLVSTYVGIAKRGTMSDHFLEKVTTGIRDDLGVDVELDCNMVKYTYVNFGKHVNAHNAAEVFNRWLEDIPEHALRLRLSLQQVTGSGLTAYIVIGRGMRRYPDFPWDRLNVVTEGEVDRYIQALATVNGNLYYGFNRDLGAARSTLYSSVAYVAKELLIRISGETSLTKYQGWLKRPKNPVAVQRLIDAYVALMSTRMEQAADAELAAPVLERIIGAVNGAQHNDMFA